MKRPAFIILFLLLCYTAFSEIGFRLTGEAGLGLAPVNAVEYHDDYAELNVDMLVNEMNDISNLLCNLFFGKKVYSRL